MKKKFLILFGIFNVGLAQAQVGINTQSPQGVFHIDVKGNTSGVTNISDDMIVQLSGTGVSVGLGGLPQSNASLTLHSQNKGFQTTSVKLKNTLDITTVPNSEEGMIVYNDNETTDQYPNDVTRGLYLFIDNKWALIKTREYTGIPSFLTLPSDFAMGSASGMGSQAVNATKMDFRPTGATNIQIKEKGAYAFSLRTFLFIYTPLSGTPNITRGVYYIFLMGKLENSSTWVVKDLAEMNPPMYRTTNESSYSITVGANFEVNEIAEIRIARNPGMVPSGVRAYGTNLTYWKLN